MEFRLTDKAKDVAKQLVTAWDSGQLDQYLVVQFTNPGSLPGQNIVGLQYTAGNLHRNAPYISPAIMYELSLAGLIHLHEITMAPSGRVNVWARQTAIVLLQSLKDAVAADFK